MMRLALIPIGGTIAALLAILATRAPREESPYPLPPHRATPGEAPEVPETPELPEMPEPPAAPPTEGPRAEYMVRLFSDGAFEEPVSRRRFADAKALLDALAPPGEPRPRIVVSNASADVTEEAVDRALAKLRDRCDVRKDYHGGSDEAPR